MELGERRKLIREVFTGFNHSLGRIRLQILFLFELAVTVILRHIPVRQFP